VDLIRTRQEYKAKQDEYERMIDLKTEFLRLQAMTYKPCYTEKAKRLIDDMRATCAAQKTVNTKKLSIFLDDLEKLMRVKK